MGSRLPRRLAAILYADVASYSRLTEENEESTYRCLSTYIVEFTAMVRSNGGRIDEIVGDAVLAEFPTASQALQCAVRIQKRLGALNEELPEERRLRFRVGVHLGEVIVDQEHIRGNGVNVAARLQAVAEPGGICISESVRGALARQPPLDEFLYNGERKFKNIEQPVKV